MPPSSSAELLLSCCALARLGSALAKPLVLEQHGKGCSSQVLGRPWVPTMVGNQLTSPCCQQWSLLQSPLANEISTLNVLGCYLKLSGLEGQE